MSKIKKLNWGIMSGHFGNSHIASTSIGEAYYIWITDGGFKCSTPAPDRKQEVFGSLSEAKEYCQKDFEKRIKECVDIEFEQRFYKWLSDQGSQSIEKVGLETILEIFEAMDKDEK
jgi:hypothetical protein